MKKAVIILSLTIGFGTASYAGTEPTNDSTSTKVDSLVSFSQSLIGTTYKWGGTSPSTGFDCSGFCRYVFSHVNFKVPRTSASYGHTGTPISKEEVRPGDVILFRGTDPKVNKIGHVGIVISEPGESLKFIHCSSSRKHYGVVVTDYVNSNYPKRFLKFVRVL